MWTLGLWQAEPVGAWVGPTMAVSLVVIAVAFAVIAGAALFLATRVAAQVKRLGELADEYRSDVGQAVRSGRRLLEQSQDLLAIARQEVVAVTETSRRLRRRVVKGADRVEERLADLEALYDVVHAEVEDTALDVAAGLRAIRRGDGVLGRVRRALVAGGRR